MIECSYNYILGSFFFLNLYWIDPYIDFCYYLISDNVLIYNSTIASMDKKMHHNKFGQWTRQKNGSEYVQALIYCFWES